MKLKTGYHYTSWDNWMQIQKSGLIPYKINNHPELLESLGIDHVMGVWLWKNRPDSVSHMGNVIYQLAYKCKTKVVKLAVRYDPKWNLKSPRGENVNLYHCGHIEKFNYHRNDKAVIQTGIIPPTQIKLIKIYNLVELLK